MRVKTLSGAKMRAEFTAAECGALKYAANADVVTFDGTAYPEGRGSASLKFRVISKESGVLTVQREDTNKTLICRMVEDGEVIPRAPRQAAPAPVPVTVEEAAPVTVAADNVDETAAAIAAALRNIKPSAPAVDVETVRQIVREEIHAASVTHISINHAPAVDIAGTVHPLMKKVLPIVSNEEAVYLLGPAGTGKTTLSKQVAEALKLPFYSVSSLQQKYELEGYCDATGKYVETEFYKAWTGGGVFMLDEMDNTVAEVLVAFNTAIANRYYTFPGVGRVEAHKDFHVIAAGNTAGRGASDAYNGRFQLDASTLDRFAFIKVDYCKDIELAMAGGDEELVNFIHAVRDVLETARLTYTATPRAIRRIKIMQACGGYTDAEVLQYGLCGGWDAQDVRTVAGALMNGKNKYVKIMRKL